MSTLPTAIPLHGRGRGRFLLYLFLTLWNINIQAQQQPLSTKGTQVIAHRGYWNTEGSAQNSRSSLQNALDLNVYGSEIDIWLTRDGHLFVNHDATYNGVRLEEATAKECSALILKNGEHMPELKELLQILKKSSSPTKLIIEIKEHSTLQQNLEAARATMKAVSKAGLKKRVEYISFSLAACVELARLDPEAQVAYLSGWISPNELHKLGITALDYHLNVFRQHPEWIAEAHQLGMPVNVWTVDSEAELHEYRSKGVDYITTNNPIGATAICQ